MIDSILREVQKINPDITKELLIERLRERWSSANCLAMIEMNEKKST